MSFLCGETIKERLGELIQIEDGSRPDENQIDCNSYELRIGPEVYITNECRRNKPDPFKIDSESLFTIPSGQFALLLTEEIVLIPKDLFGFISLKSKYKYLGLINISGFHVDPGWKGRLQFSVYNAGPHNITLKRGDIAFLIWFAKLDKDKYDSVYCKEIKEKHIQKGITSDNVNNAYGQVYSPQSLNRRIDRLTLNLKVIGLGAVLTFFGGFLLGVSSDFLSDYLSYHKGYKEELIKGVADEILSRQSDKDNIQENIKTLKINTENNKQHLK
ncbi:dCTP deaminase domain-containing protein [Legionella sp. WA2022007384]